MCQIVIECKVYKMIKTLCKIEQACINVYYFSFSNRQMQTYTTMLMLVMSESRLEHNESYPRQWVFYAAQKK